MRSRTARRGRVVRFRTTLRVARYGSAALERESDLVRGELPGGRNHALNPAVFSLGQLVAAVAIDRVVIECALLETAIECGLGTREAELTICSGIEAGLVRPRTSRG